MSLLQKLEIDTLRLRNLFVRTQDNRAYPSDFTLYSRGDGGTYWSSGVTASQFQNTSTALSNLESTVNANSTNVDSTISGTASSLLDVMNSTLLTYSTFAQNLSTYSVTVNYVDTQLANYSTVAGQFNASTYTTLESTYAFSTFINTAIISTNNHHDTELSSLSSFVNNIVSTLYQVSTFTNSSILAGQSSIYGSTLTGMQIVTSTLYIQAITFANNVSTDSDNKLGIQSTIYAPKFAYYDTFPIAMSDSASTLSTAIGLGDIATLSSANAFTSQSASSILSTVTSSQVALASSILYTVGVANNQLLSSVNSTTTAAINIAQTVSTTSYQQISSLGGNLSTLLSTGILDTIYQTFIQLQAYSEDLIVSTVTTSNAGFNSTSQYYITVYDSTLTYINESSFAFLVQQAYISSVSTLSPQVFSVMQSVISSQIIVFNSTIEGEIIYFESSISSQIRYFASTISTFVSTAELNVSTIVGEGVSTQYGLYSTAIETASTYIGGINYETLAAVSSIIGGQYFTAPSIILNSTNNLSTLVNVSSITGLSSIVAGIATLDITNNTNFYILVSDISSDVYYGMNYINYNLSTPVYNRDITVFIDIKSSYSNKFITLDTDNISNWLSTPRILNPYSYNLITYFPNRPIPSAETTPQVFISTFVGSYTLKMRYLRQGMYLQSINVYPYIYSQVKNVSVIYPENVTCTEGALSESTFTYRSALMNLTWETNDLNMPLGIRFVGTDSYGNTVVKWGGPFNSGDLQADVKIPGTMAPYVVYHTGYITIYPTDPDRSGSTDGNINTPVGQNFYEIKFEPLVVVNPSLNTKIRIYNPGTVNRYIQVAEIYINNEARESIEYMDQYCKTISTASIPYGGQIYVYGADKALDKDESTYYWSGGIPTPVTTAYLQIILSSFSDVVNSTTLISTIEVLPPDGSVFGLQDMCMTISNWNEPGISDNLFVSTITFPDENKLTIAFN